MEACLVQNYEEVIVNLMENIANGKILPGAFQIVAIRIKLLNKSPRVQAMCLQGNMVLSETLGEF